MVSDSWRSLLGVADYLGSFILRCLILVLVVIHVPAADPLSTMVINTNNIGTSLGNQFTLPLTGAFSYNCTVDCADHPAPCPRTSNSLITYATPGGYQIKDHGEYRRGFPRSSRLWRLPCAAPTSNWGAVTRSANGAFFRVRKSGHHRWPDAATAKTVFTDFTNAWAGCGACLGFPVPEHCLRRTLMNLGMLRWHDFLPDAEYQ